MNHQFQDQVDTLLSEVLYVSADHKATIIIEDLTQRLQLADQKNTYFSSENKRLPIILIQRLNTKLKDKELKYKSSQTKKKQINTMQNELQDIYKGNMSTFEAMLVDARYETDEQVKINQELKVNIDKFQLQIKEQDKQKSIHINKIEELNNENSQQNTIIEGLKDERNKLDKLQQELSASIEVQQHQISTFKENVETLESQNDTLEAQIDELKEKITQQNGSLEMVMLESKQLKEIIQNKDNEFSSKSTVLNDVEKDYQLFKSSKQKELEDLQKQIIQLGTTLKDLEKKFEDLSDENEDLKEKIEEEAQNIKDSNQQVKLLNEQNRKLFNENSQLSMKLLKLEEQIELQDSQSERSMTSGSSVSHFNEQFSSLEFLLEQEKTRIQQIKETHKKKHQIINTMVGADIVDENEDDEDDDEDTEKE